MRKIYSLVLMTAMLFVGANAWATVHEVTFSGTTGQALQTVINNAAVGDTTKIVLSDAIEGVTLTEPIWIGTEGINDATKAIILDLNGKYVKMTGASASTACYMFVISHGALFVENNSSNPAKVWLTGNSSDASQIFSVYGSYRSSRWNAAGTGQSGADSINTRVRGYFSHLQVGTGITIVADRPCLGSAIVIDQLNHGNSPAKTAASKSSATINYYTDIMGGSRGFAYGARVDLYGDIEMAGNGGNKKAYGIKTNGCLQSPINEATDGNNTIRNDAKSLDANGYVSNYEANKVNHRGDTLDAPFVYIHNTAHITTDNSSTRSAAVYASGYAKWMIEGTCEGNIGVTVKSGDVDINDAVITSTATSYSQPTNAGGVSGSGSAIVVNSTDGYPGTVSINISGNTEVSATAGYAIEETVTANDGQTKVDSVVISGGSFEGGNEGAIAVTSKDSEGHYKTEVVSGNISGEIEDINNNSETPQTLLVTDIVKDNSNTHTTNVYSEDGSTYTVVVSPGAADPTPESNVHGSAENAAVNWTGINDTLNLSNTASGKLKLAELEINKVTGTVPDDQKLVVCTGITLEVGKVVLGPKAVIEVEAGAKLIVTGSEGIYSRKETNIILKAQEGSGKQATFVIAPEVTSNRQPKATVQYYTTCKGATTSGRKWQRLTTPLSIYSSVSHNYSTLDPQPVLVPGATSFKTYTQYYDETAQEWVSVMPKDMKAFTDYAWTNNTVDGGITYSFKGNLQGNVADNVVLGNQGWNYMGNPFIAPMHLKTLLNAIKGDLGGSIYVWNMKDQRYTMESLLRIQIFGKVGDIKEIPSMQTFIVNLVSGANKTLDVDYANSVYYWVTEPTNARYSAPARQLSNYNSVRMHIESENGEADDVYVVESDNYSAEYEEGADALKFMNDGLNFYAVDEKNLAMLVSDNILGTVLSMKTSEDINYTISFENVRGEVYALRDNETNRVVLMNEGATYNFTAQPNATLNGRFQIVSRQEMPTAVETIEETVAPKAIYTVMGQYVGETTDWNNLPAGVYVVDGVKVIK